MSRLLASLTLLILLSLVTSGCGEKNPALDVEGAPQATKQLELMHGAGIICWSPNGTLAPRLWCWAQDQAALDSGDAAHLGLTSLQPQVLAEPAGGIITIHMSNHGVCWIGPGGATSGCFGDVSSADVTWAEAATCDISSSSALSCPAEETKDLTFSGEAFSYFKYDPRERHYPHSHEYYEVRSSC